MLVSFGADFLETWLSPVDYAGRFRDMHALKNGRKGVFFHIGPFQSMIRLARATSASMMEMTQNRTMIFGSAQPFSS